MSHGCRNTHRITFSNSLSNIVHNNHIKNFLTAKTKRLRHADLMLGLRRRRWTSINSAMSEHLVDAGLHHFTN